MKLLVFRLSPGREKLAKNFHPWVFSGALDEGKTAAGPGGNAGTLDSIARVEDARGVFVAWGQVNPRSKIRIRLCSWDESIVPDQAWLEARISRAVERRRPLFASGTTTVLRLIFGEADDLPGIVVDRLGDWVVVQLETAGSDSWRQSLKSILPAVLNTIMPGLRGIVERSDSDGRSLEGLAPSFELWWGEEMPESVELRENGIAFSVASKGQKTGFYADQRNNRAAVALYAPGRRVLDVCCYSGAFSMYAAAAGARDISLLDSSADAIELARRNLKRAGVEATAIQGDAFKKLRELQGRERFGLIVLDPPKLAPKRGDVARALGAYKDLNLQAIRLLEPGGILASFSCSGSVGAQELRQAIAFAAKDEGRQMQILHQLHQSEDHPVPLAFPEAEYLKGFILRLL